MLVQVELSSLTGGGGDQMLLRLCFNLGTIKCPADVKVHTLYTFHTALPFKHTLHHYKLTSTTLTRPNNNNKYHCGERQVLPPPPSDPLHYGVTRAGWRHPGGFLPWPPQRRSPDQEKSQETTLHSEEKGVTAGGQNG